MHKSVYGIIRFCKSACHEREGQALPLMLVLMAVGGLVIGPSLSYMDSGLKSGSLIERRTKELYAVDAGLEHGFWTLRNSPPEEYPLSYQLPDVNGMPVNVTLSMSNVLWGFTIGPSGVHSDTLLLYASMVWNSARHDYDYTLAITNTNGSVVHIDYVMVTPPSDFSYVAGSTSGITNLTPEIRGDPNGNMGLIWDFDTPRPTIPGAPNANKGIYSTVYHRFRLTGPEGYAGGAGYIWVAAEREDIGTVSTAAALKVVAQVMRDGVPSTTATSLVLRDNASGDILVGSWQLN